MDVPALARILIVFAGILLANRFRLPLGLCLLLGGVGLQAWSGAPAVALGPAVRDAFTRTDMWLLVLIVALIIEFGRFLADEPNARVLMNAVQRWAGRHGRAAGLMAIPAVIGLVPMPGGALFSAPLVGRAATESRWTPEWKSVVNYWFRHVWEYWWPLYPVVIVTLSIFDVVTWRFVAVQVPVTLAAIASGFLLFIRPHLDDLRAPAGPAEGSRWRLVAILLPLALIVLATLLLPPAVGRVLPEASPVVRRMVAMLAGLVAGLLLVAWYERHRTFALFRGTFTRKHLGVLFTVVGVMVFKELAESSGLLPRAGEELLASGTPLVLVIALLPFVAGLVTGLAIGFAAPAFPLAAGLLEAPGSTLSPLATIVLAYACGYAGMMLSPVHLCLVLTREYFTSSYGRIFPVLARAVGLTLALAVAWYAVLARLGW